MDNGPLLRYLTDQLYNFPEGAKRRISLGAVNVETGEFEVFDQTNTVFQDFPRAAVASSSIPGVFPPHVWKGRGIFMDGGTVYNTNMTSAIQQCLDMVDDETKITIDLMVCSPPDTPPVIDDPAKTIGNVLRSRNIHKDYSGTNNIMDDIRAHPNINYRYLVYETENKASGISEIEFEGEKTWVMQETGRKDAQDSVTDGAGANFEVLKTWSASTELKKEFPRFRDYLISIKEGNK